MHRLLISTQKFNAKPEKDKNGLIHSTMKQTVIYDMAELYTAISNGQTIVVNNCTGTRKEDNFIDTTLIGLDFDNSYTPDIAIPYGSEHYLTPEAAIQMARTNGLNPALVYHTFSSKPGVHDKFRMIFAYDEVITTEERRAELYSSIASVFVLDGVHATDLSCGNHNRLFYGTNVKEAVLIDNSAVVTVADVKILSESEVAASKKLHKQIVAMKSGKKSKSSSKSRTKGVKVADGDFSKSSKGEWSGIGPSSNPVLEAIQARDVAEYRKLIIADMAEEVLNEVGLSLNRIQTVEVSRSQFAKIEFDALIGLDTGDAITCICKDHKDNNPSSYIMKMYDETYKVVCPVCGAKDYVDVVREMLREEGKPYPTLRDAVAFIEEALNIRIIADDRLMKRQVLEGLVATVELTDTLEKYMPNLLRKMKSSSLFAHWLFMLKQGVHHVGSEVLTADDELCAFYQSTRESEGLLIQSKIKAPTAFRENMIMLRHYGLIRQLGFGELSDARQAEVKAYQEVSGHTKQFVSHYAFPDYMISHFEAAEKQFLKDKKAGVTKKIISRSFLAAYESVEKANEVYGQQNGKAILAMSEDEERVNDSFFRALKKAIKTQGFATEADILSRIRLKGIGKTQKETFVKRIRSTTAQEQGYAYLKATNAVLDAHGIERGSVPTNAGFYVAL